MSGGWLLISGNASSRNRQHIYVAIMSDKEKLDSTAFVLAIGQKLIIQTVVKMCTVKF